MDRSREQAGAFSRGAGAAVASRAGIATYADAVAFLNTRLNLETIHQTPSEKRHYQLDRMKAMLAALGNPQEQLRLVHVAGTKGKGSTCAMVSAGLEGCGYTVGMYTSPHLVEVRERIAVNRKKIGERDFASAASAVARAASTIEGVQGECTYFELLTAMGLWHFAAEAVDVAVIEVGLGGLLDCTNVISPEVAAVSLIGIDHTAILGKTLESIAAQKGGIYKHGVPALAIEQDERVLSVLRECAGKVGAPFEVVGREIDFTYRMDNGAGGGRSAPVARVQLTTARSEYEHVAVPLEGEHQARNCGLALAIIEKLAERGFRCPAERVIEGLSRLRVEGRFELVGSGVPRVLLDGAHNPESVRALMKTIGQYLQYDALVVIFGCAADKEVQPMLQALSMAADKVIFTRAADNKRAMDPAVLAKRYGEIDGKPSIVAESLEKALQAAKRSIGGGDVLCITGSFYLVGEAKKMLAAKNARK